MSNGKDLLFSHIRKNISFFTNDNDLGPYVNYLTYPEAINEKLFHPRHIITGKVFSRLKTKLDQNFLYGFSHFHNTKVSNNY